MSKINLMRYFLFIKAFASYTRFLSNEYIAYYKSAILSSFSIHLASSYSAGRDMRISEPNSPGSVLNNSNRTLMQWFLSLEMKLLTFYFPTVFQKTSLVWIFERLNINLCFKSLMFSHSDVSIMFSHVKNDPNAWCQVQFHLSLISFLP